MWARVLEILIALWLVISPSVFHSPFLQCIIAAILVALFALLSFWHPLRKIHLLNLGVSFWLWGAAYSNFPELATPLQENFVIVGMLLLMLAIVPTHSHRSPHSWQKFLLFFLSAYLVS